RNACEDAASPRGFKVPACDLQLATAVLLPPALNRRKRPSQTTRWHRTAAWINRPTRQNIVLYPVGDVAHFFRGGFPAENAASHAGQHPGSSKDPGCFADAGEPRTAVRDTFAACAGAWRNVAPGASGGCATFW